MKDASKVLRDKSNENRKAFKKSNNNHSIFWTLIFGSVLNDIIKGIKKVS